MSPELAGADRAEAVRDAARGWRRAGLVDDAALEAIAARWPDDRARVGVAFRILLFIFTALGIQAAFGFVVLVLEQGGGGAAAARIAAGLAIAYGLALLAATELQVGRWRRRQGGTEAATSLLAICFVLAGMGWFLFAEAKVEAPNGVTALCLIAAALCAAAAWRWGYPFYAAVATAAVLVAVAVLPPPAGRLLWIVLPALAAPVLVRLAEAPRLPPAHRASATAVLVVSLVGLYLAVDLLAWDLQLVEAAGGHYRGMAPAPGGAAVRVLAAAATALLPVLLIGLGAARRRLSLLLPGVAAAAASVVTFDHYANLAPLWLRLALAGAFAIGAALALWRRLDSGPAGERGGFTAADLFQDRQRGALLEAGVVAVLSQPPETRAGGEPEFSGGGGRSGGAGATGEF
jgi:hypothetical protein